jgi:hypothetical protein
MKMKSRLFLALGFCFFSMAGLAFSQGHYTIELPEASNPKPDLKKEQEKKEEAQKLTKDTAALKIKLMLSSAMPIFSVKISTRLHE